MARVQTIDAILNADIKALESMSKRDLKSLAQSAKVRVSTRQKNLVKAGIRNSQAQNYLKNSGSKQIRISGTKTQLIEEISRAQHYLSMQTSTVKGYREQQKKIKRTLEKEYGKGIFDKYNQKELDNLFSMLDNISNNQKVENFNYRIAMKFAAENILVRNEKGQFIPNAEVNLDEVMIPNKFKEFERRQYEEEQEKYNAEYRQSIEKLNKEFMEKYGKVPKLI